MPDELTAKDVAKEIIAAGDTPKKRPGYKTTEFWLAAIALIAGLLMTAGVLETGSTWEKVAGLVVAALASMGYSAARGRVKAAQGD